MDNNNNAIRSRVAKTLCLTFIAFSVIKPLGTRAESEFVTLLSNKNYVEKQEFIKMRTENNNKLLEELTKELEESENSLKANYEEVMSLNSSYKEDKNKPSQTNVIKMWDMLLGSDSVGDFFKNMDLARTIIVKQNKALNDMKKQEDILVEKQEGLINNYNDTFKKIEKIKEENADLEKIKNEIESQIKRKGTITYNPYNLLERSNVSLEDLENILRGTALYDLAPTYLECENEYGVNALFIIALSAHESSWGTSRRATEDNNLTGFGVYSDSSVGLNSNSKRENILRTASWLKTQYLVPTGLYYKGTALTDVNKSYAKNMDGSVNTEWAEGIDRIANELFNRIK